MQIIHDSPVELSVLIVDNHERHASFVGARCTSGTVDVALRLVIRVDNLMVDGSKHTSAVRGTW